MNKFYFTPQRVASGIGRVLKYRERQKEKEKTRRDVTIIDASVDDITITQWMRRTG